MKVAVNDNEYSRSINVHIMLMYSDNSSTLVLMLINNNCNSKITIFGGLDELIFETVWMVHIFYVFHLRSFSFKIILFPLSEHSNFVIDLVKQNDWYSILYVRIYVNCYYSYYGSQLSSTKKKLNKNVPKN